MASRAVREGKIQTVEVAPEDEHNARLLAHVHPRGWQNPEPRNPYNLVVLGGGTAGLVSAAGAASLGARVALVEKHLMGGDCLNYGCVPSKALIRCATARADVRGAAEFGVRVEGGVSVDFGRVMERMRRLRAHIAEHDSARRFSEMGVDVFLGEGRFTGRRGIEVEGRNLRFAKAVIATGSRPRVADLQGLAGAGYLTNETIFSLTERPTRLGVIGGGPIGCELAQTFQRLGSRVTLLQRGPHLLAKEDADAAELIQRALVRDGVQVELSAKVESAEKQGSEKVLRYLNSEGRTCEARVDEILIAAGRSPNVQGLGLEEAGVAFDRTKGVLVDDRLRTTNRRIFAAGDVCSRHKFTHAADFMARAVLSNALFMGRQKASALFIPWCTYTDPQVAHVGITEHEAAASGVAIDTIKQQLHEVDRAVLDGEAEGFAKVHVKEGTDKVLGATVVARNAGDMIGLYTMCMKQGLGLKALSRLIQPYPTQAEAIRKTGDLYNRGRLTPRVKKLLAAWMGWQRRL